MTEEATQGSATPATGKPDQPATGATPQASTSTPAATAANPPPATGTSQDISSLPDWAQTLVSSLRRSEQTLNNRIKGFEDAGKSEQEKRETRIAELESKNGTLEQQVRDFHLQGTFASAATAAGALSPALLYAVAKSSLQSDPADPAKITNIKDVLDGLRKSHPEQFRRGDIGGGAGGQAAGSTDMTALMRQMAGRR